MMVLALAVSMAACSDDGDGDTVDAGMTDAAVATSTVTGRVMTSHVTRNGTETVPVDLAANLDVTLMTVDADGVFTNHAGTGTADGTFEFADVPEGMTYVRRGIMHFYTDQRTFDLSESWAYRANATASTQATILDLEVDGLAPWTDGHSMQMSASGTDSWIPLPLAHVPANGETTLSTAMDYHAVGNGSFLIDAAQGDKTWFSQLASQTVPDTSSTYSTVVKALNVPNLTVQDGQTTNIAGTFQDVPQDISVDVDWRGAMFAEMSPQMIPGTETVGSQRLILVGAARLSALEAEVPSAGADLLVVNLTPLDEDIALTVSMGNPFPEDWHLSGVIVWTALTTVDDGVGGTLTLSASYIVQDTLNGVFGGPIQPTVAPVQDLRIDGLDADVMQTDLPESPELSWSPPAQGPVDFYEVNVQRLQPGGNEQIARLRTFGTSIRIPPGIMEVGERYAFEVRTWVEPGAAIAGPFGRTDAMAVGRTTHIMTR